MIEIDGSYGEGGGQILRTSLALSALTGQPVHLTRIRAGRPRRGLLRQHLAAVEAAAAVCQAETAGAELGSETLTFVPGAVRGGAYRFAIGSAGSTLLVLQTVLLPLLLKADTPSEVVIEGGTHNHHAPPFDFVGKVFVPLLRRMGATLDITLERHGFYPAGGGRIRVRITPISRLTPLVFLARGTVLSRQIVALSSAIRPGIGQGETAAIAQLLEWPADTATNVMVESQGPGNVACAHLQCEQISELFTAFGGAGVTRETVARRVAMQARCYLDKEVTVGAHLADQLMLPMALAGSGRFRTLALTEHTKTNIEVIKQFMQIEIRATEIAGDTVEIEVTQ